MPTLSATFKLMDGFSSKIDKMINRTDAATSKMLGASKSADKLQDSFDKAGKGAKGFRDDLTGVSAGADRANSGLKRLIGTIASLAAAKKGMDLTDTYTNTSARLGMITSSSVEKSALQNDIFAAAGRSRGDYTDMAGAVASMRMLAGDSFGSNQEAIGFTELLNKSLKVSGAGQAEQNSAFLQLTQAMAAGKLQGDEFRSIMESAPMVADAIARYMGKSKGELKELSSQGLITADIIKNAIFTAADDINGKFNSMPMTFADVWTKIKNTGMQAFGGIMARVNGMLNSDMGQALINNLTGAIHLAAGAADLFLDGLEWIGQYMDILGPIVIGVAGAFGLYHSTLLLLKGAQIASAAVTGAYTAATTFLSIGYGILTGNTAAASAAQFVYNSSLLACPITWIIGGVLLLTAAFYAGVAAVNHFAGTSVSATGLIGGAFYSLYAFLYNTFLYPTMAAFAMVANFVGNVFQNPTAAVQVLFLDMANACVGYILNMARAIENIINKIPGVQVSITSGLENFKSGLESKINTIKDESGWKEFVKSPELLDYTQMAKKGYNAGKGLAGKASNFLSGFVPGGSGSGIGFSGLGGASNLGAAGNPATVKGTGKGGAVKVENEEDIQWMRKLAERDYVARIAQNTLAPNIRVEFSGPITKEADVDGVTAHLSEALKEMMAIGPEGVPT